MSLRSASNVLAVALLAAVCAVDVDAQQPAKAPANAAQPPSAKALAKTTPTPPPQQSAPASGMVVFVDPATGKIRQPDADEIGNLTGTQSTNSTSSPAPSSAPIMISGPGGAVGVKLGDDSLNYMVVTRTADGKLAEDCPTGDKAAAALLSKGVTPKTTAAPKKSVGVLDEK